MKKVRKWLYPLHLWRTFSVDPHAFHPNVTPDRALSQCRDASLRLQHFEQLRGRLERCKPARRKKKEPRSKNTRSTNQDHEFGFGCKIFGFWILNFDFGIGLYVCEWVGVLLCMKYVCIGYNDRHRVSLSRQLSMLLLRVCMYISLCVCGWIQCQACSKVGSLCLAHPLTIVGVNVSISI